MAIEYKEITQLEKLDTLADGSYIMVVQDGAAKLISKENAKFGGGSITTFYVSASSPQPQSLENSQVAVQDASGAAVLHPDGSEVTAQEAYDAYMAGGVRLQILEGSNELFSDVICMAWRDSSGASLDSSNVSFVYYGFDAGKSIANVAIGVLPDS